MRGMVHINTGDGKGKTTASIGLGIRAWGRGMRVLMVQFLKGADTGEIRTLKKLEPDFTLYRGTEIKKFTWEMDEGELEQTKKAQRDQFELAVCEALSGSWDLIILDEIMAAVTTGMIPLNDVMEFVKCKPDKLELVLTGRDAPSGLIELADYVSEIKAVKHPMERGVPPRRGIEF